MHSTKIRVALLALGLSLWNCASMAAGITPRDTEPASAASDGVIDLIGPRHHCLASAQRPKLRRLTPHGSKMAILRHTGTGASAKATWEAGATLTDWPATLPIDDGDTVHVQVVGSLASSRVTLHVLSHPITPPAAVAIWMARMGCSTQARMLLSRL